MPGDLNRATLIGRLGKDPELRAMGNGKTVASFSIATSDKWKDKEGNDKETTEWHNIVCFRESTVRFLEHYVKKGDQVYVEGAIKTRKWEKDGVTRYSTEIVITDFNGNIQKTSGGGQGASNRDESSYGTTRDRAPRENSSSGGAPAGGFGNMDDDIPFHAEFR